MALIPLLPEDWMNDHLDAKLMFDTLPSASGLEESFIYAETEARET